MQPVLATVNVVSMVAATTAVIDGGTLMASPCTHLVHHLALKCLTDHGARAVQLLHYFAKPTDRLIQAVVAPIFSIAGYFIFLSDRINNNDRFWTALTIVAIPIAVPFNALYGICESVLLLANAVMQLFIPYQTVYAVFKGKEGALEYFDCRASIDDDLTGSGSKKIAEAIRTTVLPPPGNLPRPLTSYNDLRNLPYQVHLFAAIALGVIAFPVGLFVVEQHLSTAIAATRIIAVL